jgi:imidazolonepropionase-like amidohydrolase
MSTGTTLLALAPLAVAAAPSGTGDLLAIRVGRAETVSHGAIEHAVILVEDGKIVTIGQDLPIERGIPVLDRPGWTAMPGLVNPYSRVGLDSRAGDREEPHQSASAELYAEGDPYEELREAGVTTLGQYPVGRGLPGQAVVVRTKGDTPEELLIREGAYLKVDFNSDSRSKKRVRDAFEKVDDYIEKEKKAREKWEKEKEKASKKKKPAKKPSEKGEEGEAKKDEGKPEEKKEEGPGKYVPPEPDEKVVPFMALREGELSALVSIRRAGDYLHWIDAIGEEEFEWGLRVPTVRELDIFNVKQQIGERGCRVVMEPQMSVHPSTMRYRNLPAELASAGAKLVLLPRSDSTSGHEQWLRSVGEIVAFGLDRDVALRSITLEPAGLLGVDDRLGSLEAGKDANLLFMSSDPFETSTQVEAVMLEGRFVYGEVKP